ncbi:MAG TPA: DUF2383 domain-containing protein [Polyangiaceae bacterium]
MQPQATRTDTVARLSALCRGEISAVETYTQALDSGVLARFADQLRLCQSSHQSRSDILRRQIAALGGMPPASSGAWGSFVKIVEGAATALGEKAAIAMLEQGEDHGLNDYRMRTAELDLGSQALVREHLLPQQVETHRIVSTLKHSLS